MIVIIYLPLCPYFFHHGNLSRLLPSSRYSFQTVTIISVILPDCYHHLDHPSRRLHHVVVIVFPVLTTSCRIKVVRCSRGLFVGHAVTLLCQLFSYRYEVRPQKNLWRQHCAYVLRGVVLCVCLFAKRTVL